MDDKKSPTVAGNADEPRDTDVTQSQATDPLVGRSDDPRVDPTPDHRQTEH